MISFLRLLLQECHRYIWKHGAKNGNRAGRGHIASLRKAHPNWALPGDSKEPLFLCVGLSDLNSLGQFPRAYGELAPFSSSVQAEAVWLMPPAASVPSQFSVGLMSCHYSGIEATVFWGAALLE